MYLNCKLHSLCLLNNDCNLFKFLYKIFSSIDINFQINKISSSHKINFQKIQMNFSKSLIQVPKRMFSEAKPGKIPLCERLYYNILTKITLILTK